MKHRILDSVDTLGLGMMFALAIALSACVVASDDAPLPAEEAAALLDHDSQLTSEAGQAFEVVEGALSTAPQPASSEIGTEDACGGLGFVVCSLCTSDNGDCNLCTWNNGQCLNASWQECMNAC